MDLSLPWKNRKQRVNCLAYRDRPLFLSFCAKITFFFLFSFCHTFDTDTWAPPEDHPDARAQTGVHSLHIAGLRPLHAAPVFRRSRVAQLKQNLLFGNTRPGERDISRYCCLSYYFDTVVYVKVCTQERCSPPCMTSLSLHWWMLRWKHKRLAPFLNLRSLHLGFRLAHNLTEITRRRVNPCHKAIPFIKERPSRVQHYQTTASTQTGLEANSQFQQQSVQQTQLQPQQLQRASGARAGSTSAATAFSGETRKISLSARSVSAIPTASTSTSGVSQYLASPCSTLPRSSSIQRIPLVAPQPTQLTPQDKKATYLTNNEGFGLSQL